MTQIEIRVKPLESLVLNPAGEFTAGGLLAESLRQSLPMPLYPTLLGALAKVLLNNCDNFNNIDISQMSQDWKQDLDIIFKKCFGENYRLYGTLVKANNKFYIPLNEGRLLVSLKELQNFFKSIKSSQKMINQIIENKGNLFKIIDSKIKDKLKVKKIIKPGIGLESNKKIIQEGLFYSVELVDYTDAEGNPLEDLEFVIYVESCTNEMISIREVTRLGGEGRLAEINISSTSDSENITNFKTLKGQDLLKRLGFGSYLEFSGYFGKAFVLTSPWIVSKELLDCSEPIIVSKVLEKLRYLMDLPNNLDFIIFGRLTHLGGYDAIRKIRKPLELVLTHGSIIWILSNNIS
jgi:CRISPR type III-B/RAMP module-associated protein Cmr3